VVNDLGIAAGRYGERAANGGDIVDIFDGQDRAAAAEWARRSDRPERRDCIERSGPVQRNLQ